VDDAMVFTLSLARVETLSDGPVDLRLHAWNLADGAPLWSTPVSDRSVLPEIAVRGDAVLVRFLAFGPGEGDSGVDRATGGIRHRHVDDRLAGDSFDAEAVGGSLVLVNARFAAAVGRREDK
jgi:hypothetical protein